MDRDVTELERDYFADKNPDKLERLVAATLRAQRPLTHLFGDIALKPARFVPYGLGDNLEFVLGSWESLPTPELFAFDRVMHYAQQRNDRDGQIFLKCLVLKKNYISQRERSVGNIEVYVIKDQQIMQDYFDKNFSIIHDFTLQGQGFTDYYDELTQHTINAESLAIMNNLIGEDKDKPPEQRRIMETVLPLSINKRDMAQHPFIKFLFGNMSEAYMQFLEQRKLSPFKLHLGKLAQDYHPACFLRRGNSKSNEIYSLFRGDFNLAHYFPKKDSLVIVEPEREYDLGNALKDITRLQEDMGKIQLRLQQQGFQDTLRYENLLKSLNEYREGVESGGLK